jgi:hypothetical protein
MSHRSDAALRQALAASTGVDGRARRRPSPPGRASEPPDRRRVVPVPEGGALGDPAPDWARVPPPPVPGDPSALLTALTTEHFTLQSARFSTISDSVGRSTLFLSTVSSVVVALAFIGQVSRVGEPFRLFALILLPALFVLGWLTYLRLIESAIEDAFTARAINRIRHYYTQLDPERAAYFLLAGQDDLAGVMANTGRRASRWHLLSHTATVVLVVTSLIGGVFVALALGAALPDAPVGLPAVAGAVVALGLAGAFLLHQSRSWHRSQETVVSLFPTLEPEHEPSRPVDTTTWPS